MVLKIILAILAGAVALVLSFIVGSLIGFGVVTVCKVSHHEGKAGFYAFLLFGVPTALLGAIAAGWLVIMYA